MKVILVPSKLDALKQFIRRKLLERRKSSKNEPRVKRLMSYYGPISKFFCVHFFVNFPLKNTKN